MSDCAELIAGWWEYRRLANGSRDERKALELGEPARAVIGHDHVSSVVEQGGPEAIELLDQLNEVMPSDQGVSVGTGPLEDLVLEHGDRLADEIDQRARTSPSFARALSHVSLTGGDLQPETVQLLERWRQSDG